MAENRKIYLFEDVESGIIRDLTEKIHKWNYEDDERDSKEKDFKRNPIELYINSYGGNSHDCLGFVNEIDISKTPIHTIVTGKAMSSGLLIALSGHKRFCYKNSRYMYHQISGTLGGYLNNILHKANEWVNLMELYDDHLLEKTKIRKCEIDSIKEKNTEWFIGSDKALKLGIVDEIL